MMLVFITNYSSSALDFIFHKLYLWMKEGRLPHMTDLDFEILNQEKKKNWKVC